MLLLFSLLTVQAVDQGLKGFNHSNIFVLLPKWLPTDVPSFLAMPSGPPSEHASDMPLVQPFGIPTLLLRYSTQSSFVPSHL